jgi:hypothetical protein
MHLDFVYFMNQSFVSKSKQQIIAPKRLSVNGWVSKPQIDDVEMKLQVQ